MSFVCDAVIGNNDDDSHNDGIHTLDSDMSERWRCDDNDSYFTVEMVNVLLC